VQDARDALIAAGAGGRGAEASALLAELWWHRGQRERSSQHLEQARQLVAAEDASSSKAWVLAQVSRYLMLAGENESAVRVGREAFALAETLSLDEVRSSVLNNIGSARCFELDFGGIEDLERSIEIAKAINSPELARAYNNLATILADLGDMNRSGELRRDAVREAERFGNHRLARFSGALLIWDDYSSGNWDAFVAKAHAFLAESDRLGGWYQDAYFLATLAMIAAARGEDADALAGAERALKLAREVGDPQILLSVLADAAFVKAELGKLDLARSNALECLKARFSGEGFRPSPLTLVAKQLGIESELRALADAAPAEVRWVPLMRALLDGRYVEAAEGFSKMELRPLEAHARLRAVEHLRAEGRHADADEQLERALTFWRSVGATRYVRRGEALLAATA
jgi:tetratricopeptide (TPR) repeat protein